MGANLDRIHIVEATRLPGMKPRPFNPATDLDALAKKADAIGGVALSIIDSVVSAVPQTKNSHNNAETRTGLQPVVDFGKATHAATLGISHLTKGTIGKDPLERLTGSLAFGALPRLVMFAAKNNAEGDDEPERIMIRVKSNIDRVAAVLATISIWRICASNRTLKQRASFGNCHSKAPRATS
jgi:putative DNA primase/helicase